MQSGVAKANEESHKRKRNDDWTTTSVVDRGVARWVVDWEPEAFDKLLVLDEKRARRLLRIVSEFAAQPNAVDFERAPDSSAWYLYAPEVPGCRLLVSIDRSENLNLITVIDVHFFGSRTG
jgi:hypothetical protein